MNISTHKPRDSRIFDGHLVSKDGIVPKSSPITDLTPVGDPDDDLVFYVNGINTDIAKQRQDMINIASHGHRVIGIHNATAGVACDLAQSLLDKFNTRENGAVSTVKDLLQQSLKAGQHLALLGHSQGALICSRALWEIHDEMLHNGLTENEAKEKLGLVSLETAGGAAHTYPDGPSYHHIVNRLDPVAGFFGVNSYIPGKKPGENAEVSTMVRHLPSYIKESDSFWDLLPNFIDRTVHGVEVYYQPSQDKSRDKGSYSHLTSKETEPTSLPLSSVSNILTSYCPG